MSSSLRSVKEMRRAPTVGLVYRGTFKFVPLKQPTDVVIDLQSQMKLSSFKNACFCQNKERDKDVFFMCRCKNMAHKSCMPWRIHDFGEFECSACTILTNDPLNEVIEVLLEPSILHSCFTYKFKLKLQDFNALNQDPNLDIEVRCLKMDGEHFFEQTWPDKAEIRVNGTLVKNLAPLLYNSSLKKRRDEKLVIMKPVIGTNTISFNFENVRDGKNTKADKDPLYTFAVVLIKKLSVNELADKIIKNNAIGKSESVKLIKDKFLGSREVKISEVKADLDCKLSLSTMVHPARGKNCTHLNCFSLKLFLKSMQSNTGRNWNCPLCKKPCYKLVVDSYLENIIADTKKIDPTRREVFFRKDGSVCLTPEGEIQSEHLSVGGGSSKVGLKHTNSKHLDKNLESDIVLIDEDEPKSQLAIKPNPVVNYIVSTNLNVFDEKSTANLSDDQLLGKRPPTVDASFLEDKEFLGYLHNYTKRTPQDSLDSLEDLKAKPGFSSFESSLQKRINDDLIAKHVFQVFYSIVKKKKRETDQLKQRSTAKGIYDDILSDIKIMESTDKSMTSSHMQQLDVLQWVLRDYKLDYQNLPYQQDTHQFESDKNSIQFL